MLGAMLWRFLRPHGRPIVAVILLQVGQALTALYPPSLNARIIDNGIAVGDTHAILRTSSVMAAVTLLQIVCTISAVLFSSRVATSLGAALREQIYRKVNTFGSSEFARFRRILPPAVLDEDASTVLLRLRDSPDASPLELAACLDSGHEESYRLLCELEGARLVQLRY